MRKSLKDKGDDIAYVLACNDGEAVSGLKVHIRGVETKAEGKGGHGGRQGALQGFHVEGEMANSGPRIEIEYCTRCRWLIRAAWMAQELLSTFEEDLEGVALVPGTEGGIFEVRLAGGGVIWSRKAEGRFPEITELKRLVRDLVVPEKDLGHSDRRD